MVGDRRCKRGALQLRFPGSVRDERSPNRRTRLNSVYRAKRAVKEFRILDSGLQTGLRA